MSKWAEELEMNWSQAMLEILTVIFQTVHVFFLKPDPSRLDMAINHKFDW